MGDRRTDREDRKDDLLLEAAFVAARGEAMRPAPDTLMARIEADSIAMLAEHRRAAPAMRTEGRLQAALGSFVRGIGGWPAVGGLTTATVAGFWLGFAQPVPLGDLGAWLPFGPGAGDIIVLLPEDYLSLSEEG